MGQGVNDATIATGIFIIFTVMGVALPYIHQAGGSTEYVVNDPNTIVTSAGAGASSIPQLTLGTALFNIFKMFSWSFGLIPFWIEVVIFVPIRLLFVMLIVRNMPIIGVGG